MSVSDQRRQMNADRYLRNSARALVAADIEHIRNNLSSKTLAARAIDRINEGAADLYDEAIDMAEDNKGALAALVAAVMLWFARNPIIDLLGLGEEDERQTDD